MGLIPQSEQPIQADQIRAALNRHWQASAAGAADAEHSIYDEDAICDYLTYQGRPADTVSTMEFRNRKLVHETQYFADPFEAPAWRSQWGQRNT